VTARERIFVALDTPDRQRAETLAGALAGGIGGFKVGLELFASAGPTVVETIRRRGHPVFLDLKLHDIPNTVAGAARAAGRLGCTFLTVHALGGATMIARAVEASAEGASASGHPPPRILAVTVLTSHSDRDLESLGLAGPAAAAVSRLAAIARGAGASGIVCSPLEIGTVRGAWSDATIVVPGIRPAGASIDDQSRTATPSAAIAAGADRLVVGRPITAAGDPRAAAEAIVAEIEEGIS